MEASKGLGIRQKGRIEASKGGMKKEGWEQGMKKGMENEKDSRNEREMKDRIK